MDIDIKWCGGEGTIKRSILHPTLHEECLTQLAPVRSLTLTVDEDIRDNFCVTFY